MASLSLDDTLAVITLVAGLITAVGVFAGPYFAESLRSGRIARRDHSKKIKQNCLSPLADSIGNVLISYFRASEGLLQRFGFNDQNQPPPATIPSLLPGPIIMRSVVDGSLRTQGEVGLFDSLLFDDLIHHFPDLKKDIDRIESNILPSHGKKCLDARWKISQSLWFQLENKIDTKRHNLGDVVMGGMFLASGAPEGTWPNLYANVTSDNTIDLIKEVLAKPEVASLVPEYEKERRIVERELSKLLLDVSVVLESEKELPGKCSYL